MFLKQSVFLKKSMLGGVLLLEIHLTEPFFVVKIRAIECTRLQAKSTSPLVNQVKIISIESKKVIF